jgi:uncharacterized protein (DUF2267 family)
MDHDEFLTIVEQAARAGGDAAERATRATLQTLAERLDRGEARDLAGQLPAELAPWIATMTTAEGFDIDEFLRRVAEREEVDVATAERHARAVFAALGRAVSPRELADMEAELPRDFAPLFAKGPDVEVVPAEAFLARVAERAGLDAAGARRASDAVLETLAERIAPGETDDLISRLPVALHEPLKRGAARADGSARQMGLDEFLRRVADREGTPPLQARDHARAVLATLREAVADDEFFDVTVQLPDEYAVLLAAP